jgi:hypothetical protein
MSISSRESDVLIGGREVGACCSYRGTGADAFCGEGMIWLCGVGFGESVGVDGRRLRFEKRPRKAGEEEPSRCADESSGVGGETSSSRSSVSSSSESVEGSSV